MRQMALVLILGLVSLAAAASARSTDLGTPIADATPFNCPISEPNGGRALEGGPNPGDYGNEALGTNLAMWDEQPGIASTPPPHR